MLPTTLAQNLRKFRLERSLSQRQLAELSTLEEKFISSLETRPRHVSTRTLQRLADGLNIPASALLDNHETVNQTSLDGYMIPGLDEAIKILRMYRAMGEHN